MITLILKSLWRNHSPGMNSYTCQCAPHREQRVEYLSGAPTQLCASCPWFCWSQLCTAARCCLQASPSSSLEGHFWQGSLAEIYVTKHTYDICVTLVYCKILLGDGNWRRFRSLRVTCLPCFLVQQLGHRCYEHFVSMTNRVWENHLMKHYENIT